MRSPWRSILPWLVLGVAAAQFTCALQGPLTPWKGGGFGMFASIDAPHARFLSVTAVDSAGTAFRVALPSDVWTRGTLFDTSHLNKVRAFPTHERLRAVAAAVLRSDLVATPRSRTPPLPPRLLNSPYGPALELAGSAIDRAEVAGPVAVPGAAFQTQEVRVVVLRVRMDINTSTVSLEAVAPSVSVRSRSSENR